jgi:hypothetical protein
LWRALRGAVGAAVGARAGGRAACRGGGRRGWRDVVRERATPGPDITIFQTPEAFARFGLPGTIEAD